MKRISLFLILAMLFSCKKGNEKITHTKVSNTFLERVEPPNWWIGFKNTYLQLLVKEENIGLFTPEIKYSGIKISKVHKAKSNNYLFIDLEIDKTTKPGKFDIVFKADKKENKTHTYELFDRNKPSKEFIGFNNSDVIYLITPDRYANGNTKNDIPLSLENKPLLKEKEIDRSHNYKRHGGDIQGIINSLNYIHSLGFTAIWPSPLLTNDMPKQSYHGYAMTNYYEVDPRFGTLSDYKELSNQMKSKGMKLIMDQVANHCGLEHWWMKDLPFSDWVNNQKNYEDNKDNWGNEYNINSNHRRTTNQDLYAAKADKEGMANGWFVPTMPDLNQRNPFMATYLIQNSIWWIETLELGGIRQDTYPYPDKEFMANWAGSIMNEYPNFNIVGEEWSYNPLLIGYWQKGFKSKDNYKSNLRSTMDFAMQKNIIDAINEKDAWNTGLVKMYEGLANDFIYPNPKDIMVFLDNHDKSRVFTEFKGEVVNTKMALSYMLSLPRTPQIYYGTEILMNDFEKPGDHGLIRTDFPGGWKGDTVNAFTGQGLTSEQKEMQLYLKKLLNFRKSSSAIQDGKTVHFAPFLSTYFLYRISEDETVVHIINKNEEPIEIDLNYQKEIGLAGKKLKNVITGEIITWQKSIKLDKKGSLILTTKF